MQDGWFIVSVIFVILLLILYWRRMLTGLTELEKIGIVVGIIVASIPVLGFVFGNDFLFPEWARIGFGIAAVGIPLGIAFIPRFHKRFIIQSPVARRKEVVAGNDRPVVPPISMCSSTSNRLQSWNELFASTNNEICIQGITLESLNHVRPTIESAVLQNKKIRLLYCKKDTELMPKIEKLVVSTSTADRIKSAIDMVNDIRDALGSDDISRSNIEMRWHDEIPTMSLVILDPRSDSGSMQIEPYPYKTSQGDRKLLIIKQVEHPDIFGVYRGAFDKLWNDAHTPT